VPPVGVRATRTGPAAKRVVAWKDKPCAARRFASPDGPGLAFPATTRPGAAMTDRHTPTTGPDAPPTAKQQRYLRKLAVDCGVTFVIPATRAQASREIQRLLARRPDGIADRRREVRAVQDDLATQRGDSARVHDDEVTGYGSSATWKQVRS